MKQMEKWIHHEFEGGSTITEEFKEFFKDYKKFVKDNLPDGAELFSINRGHFNLCGFIRKESKWAYFSVSDVRHFPYSWADNILIRTARSGEDYTGSSNNYTHLINFKEDMEKLLTKPINYVSEG